MSLDATLDYMENARFNYLYANVITRMRQETHFTHTELLSVVTVYHKFALANGPKAKHMTLKQLVIFLDVMCDLRDPKFNTAIVSHMKNLDPDYTDPTFQADQHCSTVAFVRFMAIIFSKDVEIQMKFVFSIYDTLDRGFLDREQVSQYVDSFFTCEDDDERQELNEDMIDLLFSKFNKGKDMVISLEDYCQTVRAQPLLMEFLGRVIPAQSTLNVAALCCNVLTWFAKTGNPLKADE